MYPIEEARQTLWSRDFEGYDFEMGNIEVLRKHKLYKYVVYRNPKKPRLWKKKKGIGVDMVIKVGYYTFYIEESFCGADYHYRRKWFEKCRLPRFESYPNDKLHRHIILTNKPRNFNPVKDPAKEHDIQIMNINGLLTLIRSSTKPPDFVVKNLLEYVKELEVNSSSIRSVGSSSTSLVSLDELKAHITTPINKSSNNIEHVYANDEAIREYAMDLVFNVLKETRKRKKLNRLRQLGPEHVLKC